MSPGQIQQQEHMARLQRFREDKDYKGFKGWLESQFRKAEAARTQTKRNWVLNYAFYRGNQNLGIAPGDSRLGVMAGRIHKLDNRASKAINRIRPMVRTELAKLTSQKPSAYVIPASSDDDDLFAAYAGEQVWEHQYTELHVHRMFTRAAFWMSIAGVGFLKTWWDSSKEDYLGGIGLGAPTPFNIFVPDIMEPELEDQQWVIHAYTKPVEWAKQAYALELEGYELKPSTINDPELKNSIEGSMQQFSNGSEGRPDSVMIKEMWLKPGAHALFPMGGMVTFVEDIAVAAYTDGMPYDHKEFPFIKFDHLPTDTFYCDSVITDIRDLQVQYNKIRAKIGEAIKRSGLNTLVAPKGSIVASKITNEIGQVIQYVPGLGSPQPITNAPIPDSYFSELERILMDIEDISGQHQVSKGNTPPGVTAATAISFLQEQDDNYMTTSYQSVEQGLEKLARQVLSLCVQYWDTKRKIKVTGTQNTFDVFLLSGADIRNGTDVKIEGGSALPQSRAARQALLMDLMNQGILDPNEGLKLLEIGGAQRIVDQLRQDERAAQRENIKMKELTPELINEFTQMWYEQANIDPAQAVDAESGQMLSPPPVVPVNTWDNHDVHIEVHNRFRKSQAYEYLPPEVKQVFETHVEMHKTVKMQESIQEFMNMIPSDGTLDSSIDPTGANPDDLKDQGPLSPDELMSQGGAPPVAPMANQNPNQGTPEEGVL